MQNTKQDWLEKLIKSYLIKAFYRRFITLGKHKIYLKNIYNYIREKMNIYWLKEKSFYTKARNIYNKMLSKYQYHRKSKELQKIQNKYKNLQVTEAYLYLSLNEKLKLKNEDLEIFDEMLDILFAKLKQKK